MTAAPNPLPFTAEVGSHPIGCWREPGHHGCAIAVLDRLAASDALLDWEDDAAGPLAEQIDWIAAHGVIPDAPQASLPGVTR